MTIPKSEQEAPEYERIWLRPRKVPFRFNHQPFYTNKVDGVALVEYVRADLTHSVPQKQESRLWGELLLDKDGTPHFICHTKDTDFEATRTAFVKFIGLLQAQLDRQQECPYFTTHSVPQELLKVLALCRSALKSLPAEALGQDPQGGWYYRDELVDHIDRVAHSVPQPKDTELLEFLDEVDVWVSDRIEFPAPLMARKWLGQLSRELRKRLPQPKDVREGK